MRVLAALVLLAACRPAAPPPAPEPVTLMEPAPADSGPVVARAPAALPEEGPESWLQRWGKYRCNDYDYHPNGGLQSFWCHRPAELEVAVLRSVAKVAVFASGPHSTNGLVLDSPSEFGHYDPAFVQYLATHGVSARGSAVQQATQPAYDAHLKPLARIFVATRDKLRAEPRCFEREKAAYVAAMKAKKSGFYERWFFFMNPAFCAGSPHPPQWYYTHGMDGGVDGNVTKTVVGFWLRRSLDGTYDAFSRGLDQLVAAYDPAPTGSAGDIY